jgi:tetratricopeptide (TPR) repeat protein
MWIWVPVLALAAQAEIGAADQLEAAAESSPRPAACAASQSLWLRAARPNLSRYCEHLARGHGLLAHFPDQALIWGQRAHQLVPGRHEALGLMAEAHVELGQYAQAWKRFSEERELGGELKRAPLSLHRYAIAATKVGQRELGAMAYQQLLTRVSLLGDPLRAVMAYVEGAWAIVTAHPDRTRQALSYLAEAERRSRDLLLPQTIRTSSALLELLSERPDAALRHLGQVRTAALRRELEAPAGRLAPALPAVISQALVALSLPTNGVEAERAWAALEAEAPGLGGNWATLVRSRGRRGP